MSRLVVANVSYLDVIQGTMKSNQTIVMKNKKISWIGDHGSFEKEENDNILQLNGKTVIPGLFDCHVHLMSTATNNRYAEQARTSDEMYSFIALKHTQDHLKSGFTTIREAGSLFPRQGGSLKQALNQHMFFGPRLLVASGFLWQMGNQELIGPDDLVYGKTHDLVASGKDEIIKAVRERKENGADLIKTMTTGGVIHGQESKLERSLWRDEELETLIDEAHRLGLHTAAHAHGNEGIYRAVSAGIDTVEHGSFITEETAELMVDKGTYLVPTHRAAHGLTSPETYKMMPPEIQTKIDLTLEGMVNNHKMAFEKGVKIALGTDSGTPGNHHGTTAQEITLMVKEVGMTPIQAIQSATIEAAKAIKLSEITGSIETGKFADLVVVNGNPTDDVSILENRENLEYVIRDGVVMAKKGKITER
ncbi:MAG: amidohydrolase family protein [Candidatus Kariarchaeaceae archaeon]|jgi:imidazolonepropionase-like amidohydrolase